MSRALNIDAPQDHVLATCQKAHAAISSIETLPGGCTRVVLCSADAAAIVQRRYRNRIVSTPLARTPLSLKARGVPLVVELPRIRPIVPRAGKR